MILARLCTTPIKRTLVIHEPLLLLVANVHLFHLLLKQVLLVQEQDHAGVLEPPTVADLVEQVQRLVHAVLARLLVQHLVVLGDGSHKDDRCDIVKAVDPLFALVALATDVKDAAGVGVG